MGRTSPRLEGRERRHRRVRKRIRGTAERPRLCVFRSLKHIYAQLIDDDAGRTLVAASSSGPEFREQSTKATGRQAAAQVGKLLAVRAKEKGILKAVFDRAGYRYHGRVRQLAESAREASLEF